MYSQEKVFEIGEHLADIGFALQWLKPCSKMPIKQGWSSLPVPTWPELIQEHQTGFNIGCRTGEYSRFPDQTCLIVFDVDVKGGEAFLEEALTKLKNILNLDLAVFPYVVSPRGRHYYARCLLSNVPKNCKLAESTEQCELKIKGENQHRPAWQIELMTSGRQIVLPPSIHPDTRTSYQIGEKWIMSYLDLPLLDDATISRVCSLGRNIASEIKPKNVRDICLSDVDLDTLAIGEDLRELIKSGVPKGQRSEAVFKAAIKLKRAGITDDAICSVLTDKKYQLSEKPLEERKQNRESAAQWVYEYAVKKAQIDLSPPIPLRVEYIKASEPPLEKLGELGDIIKQVAACIQAPQSIALQSCLASINFLTQGLCNIEAEIGSIPTSLYFITVAQSGDRKSTVDKFFLKPIRLYEQALLDDYQLDKKKYNADVKASQLKEKEILGNTKNVDVDRVSQSLQSMSGTVRPRYPMLIIEEPTYEGLVKHIDEDYPSVALFSSEGGRFIGGHAMNKENVLKTISGLSSIWDGDPITRLRQAEGAKSIRDRRVCLHFLIQPIILEQMVEKNLLEGQGFLSRVILVAPESIAGTRLYKGEASKLNELQRHYARLISRLLMRKLHFDASAGNIKFNSIEIADDAHALWVDFYNEVELELTEHGRYSPIRNFACKSGEHARRLAATLMLMADPDSESIDHIHMEKAICLMRYYLEEQLRIKSQQLQDPNMILAQKVLDKMVDYYREKQQKLFALHDIYKNMREVRNTKRAREIFTILEEHGYLVKCPFSVQTEGKVVRQTWQLNSIFLEGLKNES